MNKLRLTVIASILVLSGCSMAPDYKEPKVAMNDVYVNQDAAGVSRTQEQTQQWWKTFQDVELDQLVDLAQNQNITLKIASQRIQAAQSYQKAVASYKVPTISVGGGYMNAQLSKNEALTGAGVAGVPLPPSFGGGDIKLVDRNADDFILGASVSWELDLFGQIDGMSQAASIRAEQAKIMRSAVTTAITADTINNYLQYRGAEERIEIAKKNIREQEETLELVESLNRHGYGSELDVATTKSLLARTKASLPMLETAKTAHLARLAIILGENISKTQARLTDRPLPNMDGLVPTGLPSDLLTRRPDIAIAQKEIAAKNQEVGAAIANRYPHIFLTGSPSMIAGDFDDVFDSDSMGWTFGAGFSWNVFDGGRGKAQVDMQKAGFKESVLSYQNTVNAAFNEVETALNAYGQSQKYHTNILEANDQAKTAVQKAKSLYRAGLINHLSVLDAERQQNQLQDAEVVARLGTATNVVMLQKALGGDWSSVTKEKEAKNQASVETKEATSETKDKA